MYDNSVMGIRIFYCEWDRKDHTESRDLAKRAVEAYRSERLEEFTLCRDGKHAKPYVKELPDVHLSITHSGGYWACAVGPCEVGLDLQEVRDRETEAIARRFFHPSEVAYLAEHGERDAFFRIWAKKESYVKYTGDGLAKGLSYFSVVEGVPARQEEIPFRDGYVMALTGARDADVRPEKLPARQPEAGGTVNRETGEER